MDRVNLFTKSNKTRAIISMVDHPSGCFLSRITCRKDFPDLLLSQPDQAQTPCNHYSSQDSDNSVAIDCNQAVRLGTPGYSRSRHSQADNIGP